MLVVVFVVCVRLSMVCVVLFDVRIAGFDTTQQPSSDPVDIAREEEMRAGGFSIGWCIRSHVM